METSLKLELTVQSLRFIIPELVLVLGILIMLSIGLFRKQLVWRLALLVSLVNLTCMFIQLPPTAGLNLFNSMLVHDSLNFWLRVVIAFSGFLAVLAAERTSSKHPSEFLAMLLTIVLGGQLLVMSNHMVMVILSLELMSIPAYVLAGFGSGKLGAEASMKYFLYGSAATAFMIFGMSWLYGLGQSLTLNDPKFLEQLSYNNNIVLFAASLFLLAGVLFKMAAVPLHFWAADVYQPTPYVPLAVFSTIPKIAAGALLMKLVGWFSLNGQAKYDWQTIVAALAMLTLLVGNFAALWQKNVKRLMANSSIGQAGFLMCAVSIQTTYGQTAFVFYALVLVISTWLVFLMLAYFEKQHNAAVVANFAGLGKHNPIPAILLTIGLISLTGLPITAGFSSKLFVFTGLLEAWENTDNNVLLILFCFGLFNTVVSVYYYLLIPYQLFLKDDASRQTARLATQELLAGVILALALIGLFVWPGLAMT